MSVCLPGVATPTPVQTGTIKRLCKETFGCEALKNQRYTDTSGSQQSPEIHVPAAENEDDPPPHGYDVAFSHYCGNKQFYRGLFFSLVALSCFFSSRKNESQQQQALDKEGDKVRVCPAPLHLSPGGAGVVVL